MMGNVTVQLFTHGLQQVICPRGGGVNGGYPAVTNSHTLQINVNFSCLDCLHEKNKNKTKLIPDYKLSLQHKKLLFQIFII